MPAWKEWVIDITNLPRIAFCPIEGDEVVFGMTVISDRCPGHLVGVASQHGRHHAEAFVTQNPGWQWTYGSTADLTGEQP